MKAGTLEETSVVEQTAAGVKRVGEATKVVMEAVGEEREVMSVGTSADDVVMMMAVMQVKVGWVNGATSEEALVVAHTAAGVNRLEDATEATGVVIEAVDEGWEVMAAFGSEMAVTAVAHAV